MGFLRWVVYDGGPKETRPLRGELEKHGAPDAALDIHQDHHVDGVRMYAYVFGPRERYLPLVKASADRVEVARSAPVDE